MITRETVPLSSGLMISSSTMLRAAPASRTSSSDFLAKYISESSSREVGKDTQCLSRSVLLNQAFVFPESSLLVSTYMSARRTLDDE